MTSPITWILAGFLAALLLVSGAVLDGPDELQLQEAAALDLADARAHARDLAQDHARQQAGTPTTTR